MISIKPKDLERAFVYAKDYKVLYIEDDHDLCALFQHWLGIYIGAITCINTAEEGLKTALEGDFDLILIDISLPQISGLDVAKQIRQAKPDQHMILSSGRSEEKFLFQAIDLGVQAYLLKPFDKETFYNTLHRTCESIRNAKLVQYYQEHLQEQIDKRSQEIFIKTKELEYHYSTDSITGLLNKAKFLEKVKNTTKNSALLMINLDNFAQINLGYGFDVGDDVLISVAKFLSEVTPQHGLVYRLQADEFMVFLEDQGPGEELLLAEKIIRDLPRAHIMVKDFAIKVGATIGLATGKATDLFNQATMAITEARKKGKSRYEVYSSHLNREQSQKENLIWITRIKEALETDSLVTYYQPIVDNRINKTVKFECLIRMVIGDEVIPPYKFIESAKIAGLLPSITGLVVEKSFPLLQGNDAELSINVTDQDFKGLYLVEYLIRKVEELKLNPARITLEILEDIEPYLSDVRMTQIDELKKFGFKIALDDFGVSCSNFSRITQYRPDFIKIDGSFIKNIAQDKQSYEIAEIITQLARGIGSEVIAEFVADESIFKKVNQLGIEYSQGYYFGKPMPAPILAHSN